MQIGNNLRHRLALKSMVPAVVVHPPCDYLNKRQRTDPGRTVQTTCPSSSSMAGIQTSHADVCMRSDATLASVDAAMLSTKESPPNASVEVVVQGGNNHAGSTSLSTVLASAAVPTASTVAAGAEVAPNVSSSVPAELGMATNIEMLRIRQILLQPSPVMSPASSPATAQGGVRRTGSSASLFPSVGLRTGGAASIDALVEFDLPPPAADHRDWCAGLRSHPQGPPGAGLNEGGPGPVALLASFSCSERADARGQI